MLKIASIENESIVDGEGYRLAIFTQGCNHNCLGCHNPQTHDFNGGTTVDCDDIMKLIDERPWLDGITLSGGDPLFQANELIEITRKCKEKGLTVWIYTGFNFEEFMKFINNEICDKRINDDMIDLIKLADVVVDGPFILSERSLSLRFRGSTNQRLIDVKKTLNSNKITEYTLEDN